MAEYSNFTAAAARPNYAGYGGAFLEGLGPGPTPLASGNTDWGPAGPGDNTPDDVHVMAFGPYPYGPGATFTCNVGIGCTP